MEEQRKIYRRLVGELNEYIRLWKKEKLRKSLIDEINFRISEIQDWEEERTEFRLRIEHEYSCYPCYLGICENH